MYEENRFKVGLFVIMGVTLIIGFIFFLGLKAALEPKLHFYTQFDESVQGLEIGSPVKFKGVTIGNVSGIMIGKANKRIRVDMEINPKTIDHDPEMINGEGRKNMITEEVAKGLCCQLQMTGITGMKYVEIDYFPDNLHTDQFSTYDDFYIPPGTSVFQSTVDSISVALDKISKINFDGISADLHQAVKSINKIAGSEQTKTLLKAVTDTAVEVKRITLKVRKFTDGNHIAGAFEQFDKTLKAVKALSESVKEQVQNADLKNLSKETKNALQEIKNAGTQTSSAIDTSLKVLNKTLYEIKELARALENDPSSVLQGSQKKDRFSK